MGEVIDFPELTDSPSETDHNWFMYHCIDCDINRTPETETQPCSENNVEEWIESNIYEPVDFCREPSPEALPEGQYSFVPVPSPQPIIIKY